MTVLNARLWIKACKRSASFFAIFPETVSSNSNLRSDVLSSLSYVNIELNEVVAPYRGIQPTTQPILSDRVLGTMDINIHNIGPCETRQILASLLLAEINHSILRNFYSFSS